MTWQAARRRCALLCVTVLALLAGCAGLPSVSSVQPGRAVTSGEDHEPLAVEPDGPLSGDDPRQIATGFLKAQISSRNSYGVARSFLAPEASAAWRPGAAVTVFTAERDISATRPDVSTVRLSLPVVATIEPDGHLVRAANATRKTLEFRVADMRSGWRLTSVPADMGLWLSEDDVERLYTAVDVYYPSAYGHGLVADPRRLPRQGLATALARAALSAPPQWLRPAVLQAFPASTRLDMEAVPVSTSGIATVDLSGAALAADNRDRTAMWASLAATLLQGPQVRGLNVTVGGARLEAENLPGTVTSVEQVGYRMPERAVDALISRSGSYLAWTGAQAADAVSGTDSRIAAGRPKLPAVPAQWTLLAAGQRGRQIAALSEDRTSVRRWLNGTDVTVDSFGTDLIRPVFDGFGWLWCAGRAFSNGAPGSADAGEAGGSIWGIDTSRSDAPPRKIAVPWLAKDQVEALSISPEGQRVALVVRGSTGHRALVASVVRNASGAPVALGEPHPVGTGVNDIHDVSWAGDAVLAVLGTVEGLRQPVLQQIDGEPKPLGPVAKANGLVATLNGADGLFVRAEDDTVFTRLGSSWNSFLTKGDVVVPTP